MLTVTVGAVALVLTAGGVAVAQAHKSVTLDVDGELTTVSTFAGSVREVLADEGVTLGERDVVWPDGALTEGAEIVVRHAHQVTVERDGVEETIWTTALTASDALESMAARGGDVSLVVSRSGDRAELPFDLTTAGRVWVVADGTSRVAAASADVAETLASAGVTLRPLDEVSVDSASGVVQVVVRRVVVQEVTTTSEVAFASSTVGDAGAYKGTTKVRTAGVPGVRTVVDRVTTVDGVETARETLSDEVTTAPVDEVVAVGTKARPAPPPAAAATGSAPAAVSGDVDSLNWAALAACESGGRPDAVSRNGLYHGLYQFSVGTWQGVGGSGLPSQASAEEQTARAKALYARSGAGPWPTCGKRLFG